MLQPPIHILLVEDNPKDYRLLREILAEVGIGYFLVEHVKSLEDAIGHPHERRHDVVLLDLSLPDSEGLNTVVRCRAALPEAPIIVLTGLDDESMGVQAIRNGAEEYLVKGQIDSRLLLRTVVYSIERKRMSADRERFVQDLHQARSELEARVQERTAELVQTVARLEKEVRARRQAQEMLRESEQRFRAIFEHAAVGATLMDLRGRFIETNPAFQRMFGYEPGQLSGMTFSDLADPTVIRRDRRSFARLARGELNSFEIEERCRCRRGESVWVRATFSLIRSADHQPIYAVGLAADITERRQAEKSLADAMVAEQRRLGQELHDGLVQQLTGLGMMAKGLHEKLKSESSSHADMAGEVLHLIREAQNQGRAMLRGLRPVEVDAHGLMTAIEELVSGTEKWYNVPCRLRADSHVPVEDNNVATQVFYIAREAITNALRHAKPRSIEVELKGDNDSVVLRVRDDGIGMPAERPPDSGIGLRIMQYRARLIGAVLEIGPGEGCGTVVTCLLKQERAHDNPTDAIQ
jgi:PAS domain S-box-containing protein